MMGGALGLAVLASLAAAQTGNALAANVDKIVAINSGYHAAFFVGAVFALLAAALAAVFIRAGAPASDARSAH